MKLENKFLRFIVCYLCGTGSATAMITLINAIIDISKYEQIITAITIAMLPVAAVTVILTREEADSFERWAKRIFNSIFNMTCITLALAVYGILNSPKKIAVGFALGLIGNLLLSIPLFIVLDRRVKRKLEEINKKLKENNKKEENRETEEFFH